MSREGQIIYIIALDHAIRDRLHAVVIYPIGPREWRET